MNFNDALISMASGAKVKLPEWTGYWFISHEGSVPGVHPSEKVRVFTKTGDILDTPWIDKYKDRDDFEVTEGKMGFDFAILALKSGKKVAREGWNDLGYIVKVEFYSSDIHANEQPINKEILPCFAKVWNTPNMEVGWRPSVADMLATDWVVVK